MSILYIVTLDQLQKNFESKANAEHVLFIAQQLENDSYSYKRLIDELIYNYDAGNAANIEDEIARLSSQMDTNFALLSNHNVVSFYLLKIISVNIKQSKSFSDRLIYLRNSSDAKSIDNTTAHGSSSQEEINILINEISIYQSEISSTLNVVTEQILLLQEDIEARSERIKIIILITSVLITILITLIGLIYINSITQPLIKLTKSVKAIAKGNFNTKLRVASNDEIGDLTESINIMSHDLDYYYNNLERLIQDKTKDLKASEEKYRILIELAPLCIIIFDPEVNMISINQHGREEHYLADKTDEEALAWDYRVCIDEETNEKIDVAFKDALQGKTTSLELRHLPGTSTGEYCFSSLAPIMDEQGKVKYILFLSSDITENKKAGENIKHLDELKSRFITAITHTTRTPLTEIGLSLEMLLSGDFRELEKGQKVLVQHALDRERSILHLIDNMNTTLDIDRNTLTLDKSLSSPLELVNSVVAALQTNLELRDIKISISNLIKKPILLSIDSKYIRSTLEIIIDNALLYSKIHSKVVVKILEKNKIIRIEIKDEGIGIPNIDQEYIFSRFYRASNAQLMHPNGVGISLYIAKAIIEKHDGKFGFVSKEGKGSTFWIELPIAKS
ncbi:MAG: ATP-binding protein [bacterium]|nr:ATP-binding protein [bacterium]